MHSPMKGNTFVLPKEKHLKKRNSLETKKIIKRFSSSFFPSYYSIIITYF
ncbi:MAG TPA: hypothetical protein DHV15_12050 [Treponema sp.]|uniref:Uncharacterized protein n=1 Tax=Treponema denticola (strain ATCC 35405 / DSM 14222 / CIP 103919 / JCM 8153 / KCTC 15104) TaxID=243275 RepID=Q73MQ6_TREDE|nr:hypothetical protein TDE_1452 [Treponema denticola ATCC 35405]HCY96220.1 hypothetical protein [Treponema sp.]